MGGGLGSNYINYSNFFRDNNCIYYVVEQENFIEKGNEIAKEYNLNLNFRKDLSEIDENINIVICSSFLQYIENWKSIVSEIISILVSSALSPNTTMWEAFVCLKASERVIQYLFL